MVLTERRVDMTEHIATRKRLVDVADIHSFNDILNSVILTAEERKLMEMHYLQGMSFVQISFELGYAEVTVCKKHKKILNKIAKVLK